MICLDHRNLERVVGLCVLHTYFVIADWEMFEAKEKTSVEKTVGVAKGGGHQRDRTVDQIYELEGDHSAWTVSVSRTH